MTSDGFLALLQAQLARYDDDGFAALANRGLLRRARKDLETTTVHVAEQAADSVVVACGEHRIRFDARGPAAAQCSCPASGVCQHILAAALGLQRMGAAQQDAADLQPGSPSGDGGDSGKAAEPTEPTDPLAPLRDALLRMTADELVRHAGKAGYRWAWQFVHDSDLPRDFSVGGTQHLVIGFARPRMTLRYMGGGIEALVADTALRPVEKYRVAAVLAFQRVHGIEPQAPEPPRSAARDGTLDLGQAHAPGAGATETLVSSRRRLCGSARQLLAEAVELGLSHLSPAMEERCATLAVWAQGVELHRLAGLLRRVADHVEMLLQRAGGADEHRLLDEMTLAYAIVAALDEAAARGAAPAHLVGQARTRYEASGTLELWGLGASPWRSAGGYQGLTMLFWSPADGAFCTCTDARPEQLRGFDPRARYKAAGPWAGLGAPASATGRRVMLSGAQMNAQGRLSAAADTSAVLLPPEPPGTWARALAPGRSWTALREDRAQAGRSLLATPRTMDDWVFLEPAAWGRAHFDAARQTLCWPLLDADGEVLVAELAYDKHSAPALQRIERQAVGANHTGSLLVARVVPGRDPLVVEPLSLLAGARAAEGDLAVDALYFSDAAGEHTAAAPAAGATGPSPAWAGNADQAPAASRSPAVLQAIGHELRRLAERGMPADGGAALLLGRARLPELLRRADAVGLGLPRAVAGGDARAGERVLRLNYVVLQYALSMGAVADALE